jgi:hypothetical protein
MGAVQLRDIEILVQQQLETLEASGKDDETLREIQKILYSTEVRPISTLLFSYTTHLWPLGWFRSTRCHCRSRRGRDVLVSFLRIIIRLHYTPFSALFMYFPSFPFLPGAYFLLCHFHLSPIISNTYQVAS